jgi:DNA repair protein RadC
MIAYLRRAVLASAATHERAHAIFLDSDHAWLGDAGFGAGNMNMLALRTRALIGDALRLDAHGIILAHSHPSGDCRPSSADIAATRRLADVARALDIALVDHLIFTTDSIYSMRAGGLL